MKAQHWRHIALQAEGDEAQALCEELGITVLPTVQFWKDGAKLWEHRGIVQLQQDLGEGAIEEATHVRAHRHWSGAVPVHGCHVMLTCPVE